MAGAGDEIEIDGGDAGLGPGAVIVDHLPPDTRLVLHAAWLGGKAQLRFRTLAPPPGELLYRFATVNDIHIGDRRFGLYRGLVEPPGTDPPFPWRCADAAMAEAVDWGAESIVVKGDVTRAGRPREWASAARLLTAQPVPVDVILGNHDVTRTAPDARPLLARHGIEVPLDPFHRDVPGLRLVFGHTAADGQKRGSIDADQAEAIAKLCAEAEGPAFIALHHYLQRYRFMSTWPPGVPGDEARPFLDTVAAANPATFVATGHGHRNRRHSHGPIVLTQIGSTKDYPGTWAGYAVHEGGLRQVVRRVARPDAIAWTDRTRKAVLGLWGHWAPGVRSHRCFSHTWPSRGDR